MGPPPELPSIFHRVSRIVNSDLSLDEMLGEIVGLTSQASGCDACLVYLAESSTGEFVLRASQVPRASIGNTRIRLGEGVTGWAARHQTPVALRSRASADPRFKAFPSLVEDTYEAFLSVPFVHKGRTIGVINVHHRERHDYSEGEIAAISFIGEQMGGAIANSLLEDENTRLAERDLEQERRRMQLEAEVARRTADLKATNDELRIAKDKAEEMTRLKSEFLANMSHEIRTPMNGIIGFTQLTLKTPLNSDQRDYLEIVESSAHALLGIINDILDFSKIEAGRLELERELLSLRKTVSGAASTIAPEALRKGLDLSWDIDPGVPDALYGDATRLRQVLLNLLGNAAKFTARGFIRVEVHDESVGEAGYALHFVVRDSGIGIPPEQQRPIFEPFRQADGSTTRKYGGTGLGLAISARLVKNMQGKIWVESQVGRGSSFHFTACFGTAAAPWAAVDAPGVQWDPGCPG
jgi:signal transduction histidine kinase